eukprot:COSAG06_NODE_984_length_11197_cov_75.225806_7_plen_1198_part_00
MQLGASAQMATLPLPIVVFVALQLSCWQYATAASLSSSLARAQVVALADRLQVLMAAPFESIARAQRQVELGFLDTEHAGALQRFLYAEYAEVLTSGEVRSRRRDEPAWWHGSTTMVYVGSETGHFAGYRVPEGESAQMFVQRVPGDATVAESLWVPHTDLASVNDCIALGVCEDMMGGRVIADTCPAGAREDDMDSCTECCTTTCCDRDIQTMHEVTYASRGEAVSFWGWQAYDPRHRPWYIKMKSDWMTNHSRVQGWSTPYVFSLDGFLGMTAMGALVHSDGTLAGIVGVDYTMLGISASLWTGGEAFDDEAWAFVVERPSGLLVGTSIHAALFNETHARVAGVDVAHTAISSCAHLLAESSWPTNHALSGDTWEAHTLAYVANGLEWLIVSGRSNLGSTCDTNELLQLAVDDDGGRECVCKGGFHELQLPIVCHDRVFKNFGGGELAGPAAYWPNAKTVCGGCTVLVENDAYRHATSCTEYCNQRGRQCTGAWEEFDNTCTIEETMDCDDRRIHTSTGGSDTICECGGDTCPVLPSQRCRRCDYCVACASDARNGTVAQHSPLYIQVFGPRRIADIFKCDMKQGCHGVAGVDNISSLGHCKTCVTKTLELTYGCEPNYEGHFCSTCVEDFEMKKISRGNYTCVPCESVAQTRGILIAVFTAILVLSFTQRDGFLKHMTTGAAFISASRAVVRSCWQPIRIAISYFQVISHLPTVLNFEAPPFFDAMVTFVGKYLSGIDLLASAKCLGVDTFHYKWRIQVLFIPLFLVFVSSAFYFIQRRKNAAAARSDLDNAFFFTVFFCYPRICTYCFAVFHSRQVHSRPDVHVLLADDRLLYEDETHTPYVVLSCVVIALVAFGVPTGTAVVLYRENQQVHQLSVSHSLKALVAEAFEISLDDAGVACGDILRRSKYTFLTAAYKHDRYWAESTDMFRKLGLLGLLVWFPRGSVVQILFSFLISAVFCALHFLYWPYKFTWDNRLRAATECHVMLLIAFGLASRTDFDSPWAPSFADSAPGPKIQKLYEDDISRATKNYDILLCFSFVVCVPLAFIVTIVSTLKEAKRALSKPAAEADASGDLATRMRFAFERMRYGLATFSDRQQLQDFVWLLQKDEHERAGTRLWRNMAAVAHLSSSQMAAFLGRLEDELPKSHALGFHFTDLDSARLILSSTGIRASKQGQLGGGVYPCVWLRPSTLAG